MVCVDMNGVSFDFEIVDVAGFDSNGCVFGFTNIILLETNILL